MRKKRTSGKLHVQRQISLRLLSMASGIFMLLAAELILRITVPSNERWGADFPLFSSGEINHYFQKVSRVEGEFYATNPQWLGLFNYQEFVATKPQSLFRIFCIGGSATYGYPFGSKLAWPVWLEHYLCESFPRMNIEVINAGADCYGSTRLVGLAEEVMNYSPNLIIILSGNNEYLEPATFDDISDRSGPVIALSRFARHSCLFRFFESAIQAVRARFFSHQDDMDIIIDHDGQRFALRRSRVISGEEIEATVKARSSLQNKITSSDRRLTEALFKQNIATIVSSAKSRKIDVLLMSVPTNLADWPPNLSSPDEDVTDQTFVEQDSDGILSMIHKSLIDDGGEIESEICPLEGCSEYDAMCAFLCGIRALKLSMPQRAYDFFILARDLDALPLRANSALNKSLVDLGDNETVFYFDLERRIHSLSSSGIAGYDMFWDFCHPTPPGHRLIGNEIARYCREHVLHSRDTSQFVLPEGSSMPDDSQHRVEPELLRSPWSADMIAQMGYLLEWIHRPTLAKYHYRCAFSVDSGNETARAGYARLSLKDLSDVNLPGDRYFLLREQLDELLSAHSPLWSQSTCDVTISARE